MFCSHCGKKVTDAMLFCPFCGEAIVMPEQDEAETTQNALAASAEPADDAWLAALEGGAADGEDAGLKAPPGFSKDAELEAPPGSPEDAVEELLNWSQSRESGDAASDFSPLQLEEAAEVTDWREEIQRKKAETQPRMTPDMHMSEDQPVRLEGHAPRLDGNPAQEEDRTARVAAKRRAANTLVPAKSADDIFMDTPDAYDDFDAYDGDYGGGGYEYEDEDDEDGGFLARHIRGLVGLSLFVVLVLMFAIYAFSEAGQTTLARFNLAWRPEIYNSIAYDYYQQEQYGQAGVYYERALTRDAGNYNIASSAAMAYIGSGNTGKAAEMLKRCVEIDPSKAEPYIYLLNLYPDVVQRPWDITQLIRQGYQNTGDDRLKDAE